MDRKIESAEGTVVRHLNQAEPRALARAIIPQLRPFATRVWFS